MSGISQMKPKGHEKVDLNRWMREFTVERDQAEWEARFPNLRPFVPDGPQLTNPRDLAILQHLRNEVLAKCNLGVPVATDVFLIALGEPQLPYLTKVGGIPYRPRTMPWPKGRNGQPLCFLGQHCFVDSADLFEFPLPGDVLLHFVDGESALCEPDKYEWHMEWQSIREFELLEPDQLPAQSFRPRTFHGHVCRTVEYPDQRAFEAFEHAGYSGSYLLATTQATRIGGSTFYIQCESPEPGETLLCTLNSITLNPWIEFPFINHPDRLPFDWHRQDEADKYELMIGDVGCIYWFVKPDGTLRVSTECY